MVDPHGMHAACLHKEEPHHSCGHVSKQAKLNMARINMARICVGATGYHLTSLNTVGNALGYNSNISLVLGD